MLTNIQDFRIIFEDLCSISDFFKLISPQEAEKHEKVRKGFIKSVYFKKNRLQSKSNLGFGRTLAQTAQKLVLSD